MPSGETQRVFIGGALGDGVTGTLRKKVFNQLPVSLLSATNSRARHIFSPANLEKRELSEQARSWIDRVLYKERMRARHEGHNLWKTPTEKYTQSEIQDSRLVCKNLNGIQYLGDEFREMYPDATFLCLVRHPLALAEGRLRRGQEMGRVLKHILQIGHKMIDDLEHFDNYHLLRFEDMVTAPNDFLSNVYDLTGLSVSALKDIRFQNKATLGSSGSHDIEGVDRSIVWYPISEMEKHLKADINANQFANMSVDVKKQLLNEMQPLISAFGYDTWPG